MSQNEKGARPLSSIPSYQIRGAFTTSLPVEYGEISMTSLDERRKHHCERFAQSDTDDVRWYCGEGIRLLGEKERALENGSKEDVAVASARCERHFQEWEDKDLAESDADRGVKDRSQRQEQARLATKAREERRGDWRKAASETDASLLSADPEMPLKARAAIITVRLNTDLPEHLNLSERTVTDYLYSTTARRQRSSR
jgi:hypothetical protein